jgi:hypothetical protein
MSESRQRRPRLLSLAFYVASSAFLVCALAYILFESGTLPDFLPRSNSVANEPHARDIPMALAALGIFGLLRYGSWYAQRHNRWLRSERWHHKRGHF